MSNFLKNIVKSGFGILTSRIFGLLRDVAIAAYYGASGLTDAFFMAFAIPNLFRAFFAEGALSSAFVPFLSDNLKKGDRAADKYLTGLIFAALSIIIPLSALLMYFSDYVILLFMPGYADNSDVLIAGSFMLKILMPYLAIVTVCAMLSGYLNIKGSYYVPHSSTAVLNIFMVAGAYFGYRMEEGIAVLCYSVIAGGVAQLLYIYLYAFIKGYKLASPFAAKEDVRKTFKLMLPSMVGVGITQLNFTLGRVAASFLTTGSISYLYYANRLFQFPLGLFGVSVGTVSLTEISKANTDNDAELRKNIIDKAIMSLLLVILPATAGLIVLSDEITALVFARKEFSADDIAMTSVALKAYSIGLLFYTLINVLSRVFHSEKDTKTPVKAAAFSFVFYCVSLGVLTPFYGHSGVALASSISAFINSLYLYMKIKNYRFSIKDNSEIITKIIFATVFMTALALGLGFYSVHIIINILLCIVSYFTVLKISGISVKRFLR